MQSINPAETVTPFAESDLANLALTMQQHIASIADQCQKQLQSQLAAIWSAKEEELASLPQRMVSDHLSTEDPAGLPYYHPVHWFRSQWEFKHQGCLEFPTAEAATNTLQEILNQLQPEITAALAVYQTDIVTTFDHQIQQLRQSLKPVIQSQLADARIVLNEYINHHVPLAKLQLAEVDRFGFFQDGKRIVASQLVTTTSKTIQPWYFLGLRSQNVPCHQIVINQLQAVVEASITRSFQHIQTRIADYANGELPQQVQQLLANVE